MNKKIGLIVSVLLICVLGAAIYATSIVSPSQRPTKELEFTVSGSSDCLRFLNNSVPTIYVPFTVAAHQNMQLTVNCTKMPGGVNGWTDVYVYNGYWNGGTNNTCISSDIYPILNDIQSTELAIRLNSPFTETFGASSTLQSYTVFFVVPPGGQQATFHVTLKPAV